jgi:hypothetical protein
VGLKPSAKRMAPGKVLDDALLGDVFGIEMAETALPAKPTMLKATVKKPAKVTAKSFKKQEKPMASTARPNRASPVKIKKVKD